MGPIMTPLPESAPTTPSPENEEDETPQATITALQEENEKLKSEIREMAEKLEAAEASRKALLSQVSCLQEVSTTQQDDIKSLRTELVEAKDQRDRLMAGSNAETAAPQVTRTTSQGGPGSNRMRSKRGSERNESNKTPAGNVSNNQATRDQATNLEPISPLDVSVNRRSEKSAVNEEQNVERKVKGLLNKLTMEKFDSISDQIIEWANKSEAEKDGRTLIHVVRLVFEKAIDEAALSEMYAQLCSKMMKTISPNVRDDGIRNAEGEHITGGQLFRKYLVNCCQEDFERGWAARASEDAAVKKVAEGSGGVEHHTARRAKRRGLGLIQFIGELYKLQMLTERIMHECIKKLLANVENPEEEEIESLCRLLTTVGSLLDNPKARGHMDTYFARMEVLGKSNNVTSRVQLMLRVSSAVSIRETTYLYFLFITQDLIELREQKWIPKNQVAALTVVAQVHEEVNLPNFTTTEPLLTASTPGSKKDGSGGEGNYESYPYFAPWRLSAGPRSWWRTRSGTTSQWAVPCGWLYSSATIQGRRSFKSWQAQ